MKLPSTKIIKLKGSWKEVLDDCRFTVNKDPLPDYREPSDKFKKEMLIAEHSPIRDIIFKWVWKDMPHWVTVHWVRHKWEKFVQTQRTDRTGIDRTKLPQDQPQSMIGEANTQHLIDSMKKRLCNRAAKETRDYAISLKQEITKIDKHIGSAFVPHCIYRGGCPEPRNCGYYDSFVKKYGQISNLQERYDCYNHEFENMVQSLESDNTEE